MRHWSCACAIALLPATGALAQCPPVAMFSTIAGQPTSDVPGAPGLKFTPSNFADGCFRRVSVSPSGGRWVIRAEVGPSADDAVIAGVGPGPIGASVLARVGQASFVDGARTYESLGFSCAVNDAGTVVLIMNLSGATTDDDLVARHDAQGFRTFAREGSQAPAVALGANYGSVFDSAHASTDGSVRFRHAGLAGQPADQLLYNLPLPGTGLILARTDLTQPASQLASPPQTVDVLPIDQARSSADGTNLLFIADLNGPTSTDFVAVLDGVVVAQEGFVLPGSGFTSVVSALSSTAGAIGLSPANAHAIFLGRNADGVDWIASPGTLRASTDAPIFAGSAELYSDARFSATFVACAVNSAGEFLVAGYTDAAADRDAVVVLNNTTVLLREGDPVDVSGDGLPDDGVFVAAFADAGLVLADDRRVYARVALRTGTGAAAGSAIVTLVPPGCNDIDFNNDGVFPDNADILDFQTVLAGGACPSGACDSIDFNNDCVFPDNADLLKFIEVFAGGAC